MNGAVNNIQNLALSQGNVILQVLDKKGYEDEDYCSYHKENY